MDSSLNAEREELIDKIHSEFSGFKKENIRPMVELYLESDRDFGKFYKNYLDKINTYARYGINPYAIQKILYQHKKEIYMQKFDPTYTLVRKVTRTVMSRDPRDPDHITPVEREFYIIHNNKTEEEFESDENLAEKERIEYIWNNTSGGKRKRKTNRRRNKKSRKSRKSRRSRR